MNEKLKEIRALIIEKVGPRLDQLKDLYDKLERREKLIVNGVGILIAVMIIYSLISALFSSLSQYERKIQEALETANKIETIISTIANSKTKMDRYERLLARRGSSFSLTSFLEREAQKRGLVIKTMSQPKVEELGDQIVRVGVDVDLSSNAKLNAVVPFLASIEGSRNLLRVSMVNIKPRFDDPQQLDVSFRVDTFDIKPEE